MMWQILEGILIRSPTLFPPTITTVKYIWESYQCFRTFRKTSDTRSIDVGVSQRTST